MSDIYHYVLSETAYADLADIDNYMTEDLANPDAAINFLNSFSKKAEMLCEYPESGAPVLNEYVRGSGIRHFSIGSYIAYYLVNKNQKDIVILRVVYSGRNQNDILNKI